MGPHTFFFRGRITCEEKIAPRHNFTVTTSPGNNFATREIPEAHSAISPNACGRNFTMSICYWPS